MSTTELPPSYNDALQGFVPPPEYSTQTAGSTAGSSQGSRVIPMNSNAREEYYTPSRLNLVVLDDPNEDPLDIEALQVPSIEYQVKTNDEIQDLYHSIHTLVEDKFIQVNRNTEFIHKKIRSMYNHYYINNLRNQTLEDFIKIKEKLSKELQSLPQIFQYYKQFNETYGQVSNELKVIKYELEIAIDHESNSKLTEGELLNLSNQLKTKSNLLKKCHFNLIQIDNKVKTMSDSEEVSYVLKERARVYNMATDFVRNQQQ